MKIQKNVSLKQYSTMRLGGNADYLTEVRTKEELEEALGFANKNKVPAIMIGGGTNIIWRSKGFEGLVIINKLSGMSIDHVDDKVAEFTIASGEDWDETVKKTVEQGYSGIEQLAYIPGTVGGTPVQNVGAYGAEIKDVLVSVDAYDSETKKYVTISNEDCHFGYRTSRFKDGADKGRYFIISVKLRLVKSNPEPPFYDSLERYFIDNGIKEYTSKTLRDAVIAIRTQKLPDPDVVANNGSFFANPIVTRSKFAELEIKFPAIVCWPLPDETVKISAAWLIESAGFKDYHDKETGMATWDKQPLVLINEHAKTTEDLLEFKQKIIEAVQSKFGITLEQEPELI